MHVQIPNFLFPFLNFVEDALDVVSRVLELVTACDEVIQVLLDLLWGELMLFSNKVNQANLWLSVSLFFEFFLSSNRTSNRLNIAFNRNVIRMSLIIEIDNFRLRNFNLALFSLLLDLLGLLFFLGFFFLRLWLMLWPPPFKIASKWLHVAVIHFWPQTRRLSVQVHGLTNPRVWGPFSEVVFHLFAVIG